MMDWADWVFIIGVIVIVLVLWLATRPKKKDTRPWWEIEQDRIDKQKKGK